MSLILLIPPSGYILTLQNNLCQCPYAVILPYVSVVRMCPCPCLHVSMRLSVYVSNMSNDVSICLCFYVSTCTCVYVSMFPCLHVSMCLSVYVSMCHISMCPCLPHLMWVTVPCSSSLSLGNMCTLCGPSLEAGRRGRHTPWPLSIRAALSSG